MNQLVAFVVGLQSLLGPFCMANEAQMVPEVVLDPVATTVFLPTIVACELSPEFGEVVMDVVAIYEEIAPYRRPAAHYYLQEDGAIVAAETPMPSPQPPPPR